MIGNSQQDGPVVKPGNRCIRKEVRTGSITLTDDKKYHIEGYDL